MKISKEKFMLCINSQIFKEDLFIIKIDNQILYIVCIYYTIDVIAILFLIL